MDTGYVRYSEAMKSLSEISEVRCYFILTPPEFSTILRNPAGWESVLSCVGPSYVTQQ